MKYDFENKPRRSFFGLGVWIIVIVLGLGVVGGVGGWALNIASQPGQIVQQTFQAENIIYNYEWFRQQYQDVQAMDTRIGNSQTQLEAWLANAPPRSDWKIQDSQTYSQLNSIVLGQKNQRAQMVANYNARASMANRSIFRAGLPETIN